MLLISPEIANAKLYPCGADHDAKVWRNGGGSTSAFAWTSWSGVYHRTSCTVGFLGATETDLGVGYTQTRQIDGWGPANSGFRRI